MTSYLPDLNFWIALTYQRHQHHARALRWFDEIEGDLSHFCRVTQLGFLRLLTHPHVMQTDVLTQEQAWSAYDLVCSDERVSFHDEPDSEQLEIAWRKLTSGRRSASKQWPDAYLVAFARTAGMQLVTFDRALRQLCGPGAVLLS